MTLQRELNGQCFQRLEWRKRFRTWFYVFGFEQVSKQVKMNRTGHKISNARHRIGIILRGPGSARIFLLKGY
jgi:hypothetical protein